MYRCEYEIARISIALQSNERWENENAFISFRKKIEIPDYQVVFRQVDTLPVISKKAIYEDNCYRVHPDGKGGYLRSFFDAPRDLTPYAVAQYDYPNGKVQIDYLQKGKHCVSELHNSFFHIGFEALLIQKGRLCIHAACVNTPLGGILFSGPSGIGKSTQAELWCNYRNAKLINGDRPILSKEGCRWLAWGSPYAGSSKCYLNENCKISAIIMLKQAPKCELRRLTGAEAFSAVWSGLTIYNWDKEFVEKASNLTMELIEEIPVFEFCCTPDEYAVEYLEQELRKRCC